MSSTPPPSAPPPPAPQPGGVAGPPANGMGTAALVLGILGFVCLGFIGSILAIVFGKMGMDKAERGEADNGGTAKAGLILGIVGLVLNIIGLVVWVSIFATGNSPY